MITGLKQKTADLENKMMILMDENDKLSELNQQRLEQLNDTVSKFADLEREAAEELTRAKKAFEHKLKFELVSLSLGILVEMCAVIGKT